jgi:hypothetical protein
MQGGMYPSERGDMRQKYRLVRAGSNRQTVAHGWPCELRIMPRPPDNDADVYIVIEDFGSLGHAYVETELDAADRESIIRDFISGQYENALRVVSFNTAEGWSRDVSEDIAGEIVDRAYDADETLTEGTKRFVDRHVTPGEKRPPAPSVLRGRDQATRKKV